MMFCQDIFMGKNLVFEILFLLVELCEYFYGGFGESGGKYTRGTAPSQRARRPPRKLPPLGPLRK